MRRSSGLLHSAYVTHAGREFVNVFASAAGSAALQCTGSQAYSIVARTVCVSSWLQRQREPPAANPLGLSEEGGVGIPAKPCRSPCAGWDGMVLIRYTVIR